MNGAPYAEAGKRAFDLAVSIIAVVALAPVIGLVAAAVALEDGFPILFRQVRVGRYGAPFEVLKFRSMLKGSPTTTSADGGELRVTAVGRLIRRTNLDELPQLLNILRGEMSLVGPRPALPFEHELLSLRGSSGALLLLPGLTGLAQVNSYDGMSTKDKAAWDARYASKISLALDAQIVARTFVYLLKRPPIY